MLQAFQGALVGPFAKMYRSPLQHAKALENPKDYYYKEEWAGMKIDMVFQLSKNTKSNKENILDKQQYQYQKPKQELFYNQYCLDLEVPHEPFLPRKQYLNPYHAFLQEVRRDA